MIPHKTVDIDTLEQKIDLGTSTHPRLTEHGWLVYPVVSRRAGGLSLGVNINPDKRCSFDCVYCQVDRRSPPDVPPVDVLTIKHELKQWLDKIVKHDNEYRDYPLKDISFAGDGEPTTVKILPELIKQVIDLKKVYDLKECKLILFTNGTSVNKQPLLDVYPSFFRNHGEIWFKIDYWDEQSLQRINRTSIPFDRLISNLREVGSRYPIVIQSCFFCWNKEPFRETKYTAYLELIREIQRKGVMIKSILAYTLARTPRCSEASPWSDIAMGRIHRLLVDNLSVEIKSYNET